MTDDGFELMNSMIPPRQRDHFQRFSVAVANTLQVIDALSLWTTLSFAAEDVDDPERQIRAPNILWLTRKTQLTADMVLAALAALVVAGAVEVVRDGVWEIRIPCGDEQTEAWRDRLWTHLRTATRHGAPQPAGAPWLPEPPPVSAEPADWW